MKSNELRIGNYVLIENEQHEHVKGAFMRVQGIEKIHMSQKEKEWFSDSDSSISVICTSGDWVCNSFNQYNQFIKPIELTEEILLKCGFVKDEFDNWENETRLGLYKPEEFDGYLSIWGDSTVGECNYLHQLQNLYFALTGEELKINL